MPAELYRARFVYGNMPCLCRDYAFIPIEECIDNRCICLSTADKKMHSGLRAFARFFDKGASPFAVFIGSVACRLFHICLYEALNNRRVCSFHIIRSERKFILSFHTVRLSDNRLLRKILNVRCNSILFRSNSINFSNEKLVAD